MPVPIQGSAKISCLILCLAVSSCTSGSNGISFAGRWVGDMVPQPGSLCTGATSSTLTRRGDQFTFAPGDGVLVISGAIAPDGHLHGTLSLVGANKQPFPLTVAGLLAPAGFTGTYSTPRCHAQLTLRPASG